MGQGFSCRTTHERVLFGAAQVGDLETFEALVEGEPGLLHHTTVYGRLSALHIAAADGRIQVLSWILEQTVQPDVLNRHKQTPLMLAAMHGKISCVQKLIQAGANILMFDSMHGRTCLHYAAYYGHSDCIQAILSAAHSTPVADSWGFARFVNVRDKNSATPLHLAARRRRADCVRILLGNGALACAPTHNYGCPGSTPLHLAARGGCLDSVRELLAWGADRRRQDSSGRIPYNVAVGHKHGACAALLNPSSAEPLVWPSPLKFIGKLNPEAKVILERALMEANAEWEKDILKGTAYSLSSPVYSNDSVTNDIDEASDEELCCICFDQVCTIEVQNCGHQMCAHCTLALCCHNKANPTTACLTAPVCPFCRSNIAELVVARIKNDHIDEDNSLKPMKARRSRNFSEESGSFKGLSSPMRPLGKVGSLGSGRIANNDDRIDKP